MGRLRSGNKARADRDAVRSTPHKKTMSNHRLAAVLALLCALLRAGDLAAVTPAQYEALAFGDNDAKLIAIGELVETADPDALPLLTAMSNSEMQVSPAQQRIFLLRPEGAVDAMTGQAVDPLPDDSEEVVMNNRMRRELASAIGLLQLLSSERTTRLQAARTIYEQGAGPNTLPLLEKAAAAETDAEIKALLKPTITALQLNSTDAAVRLAAVKALADGKHPKAQFLLSGVLEMRGEEYAEPDPQIRAQAQVSLDAVQSRLVWSERLYAVFTGLSLGSILLLAALGLAITYGLMGVINMAHGELIMVGAYTTYVVQTLFASFLPERFDWYLIAALPASFVVAALVGVVMERLVIRHLYGRPLETLLATWGISLILIQLVRDIFGAQNVLVTNPAWMSGNIPLAGDITLPYSRIVIIFFSAAVVFGVWTMLTRTRLGLFVRGVTQNRAMAGCVGVPTQRVDTYAFALGSGIAGIAGCALSQIDNVGPNLGQSYIIDSFLVVVTGGVGQLAGTIYAALGLGVINKFLEGWTGAVLAKIIVLVLIVFFIQKRPQGLFALKGRFADD
jgi:urea transport system permease protein